MARRAALGGGFPLKVLSLLLVLLFATQAQAESDDEYIVGTDANGVRRQLLNTRTPALYTGDFGDCMGGQSLLNVTLFDAAYYADNMTVLFHVGGTTSLRNENVMMYISVDACKHDRRPGKLLKMLTIIDGENRFNLLFNPCDANFASLCPMEAGTPIYGVAVIPVSKADVAGIPEIALHIPDFEGSASLRIFSNATQTEIGCYRAIMRNGATFSQPAIVGSVLGVFTIAAVVASVATAIYGSSLPDVRNHYAHSMSVLIIFEVFHYIFFSGALSLNWPSVLPAFWSNFAWSAGQIYTPSIVHSVNSFTGVTGNASQVGAAGANVLNSGGGLQQQIYGRSLSRIKSFGSTLLKLLRRQASTETPPTAQYSWSGGVVQPGLPLPGNWSGYATTLSDARIPVADSFLVGFIWFLILVLVLIGSIVIFKAVLEVLDSRKRLKEGRLAIFRNYWVTFTKLVVLRAMLMAFFMMMTLTMFQFSYGGPAGPIAIAVLVFLAFFIGMFGLAFHASRAQTTSGSGGLRLQSKRVFGFVPWFTLEHSQAIDQDEEGEKAEDAKTTTPGDYLQQYGWLSARYRRTRWWFFGIWLAYQFVRACFIGGARGSPLAQVIGLLIVDLLAFVVIVRIRPYEGMRNTALAVYLLGLSKVLTSGLSIAFLPQLNLARIPTTVVGVVIIVIQGLLVVALLILIVLGGISSYMSLTRNREHFKPQAWQGIRQKYLNNIESKATDLPPPPKPPTPPPEEPKEPYFAVRSVHRVSKIEDEDGISEINDLPATTNDPPSGRTSRTNSIMYSSTVPYGARVHRASWSSRDFQNMYDLDEVPGSPTSPLPRVASGQNLRRESGTRNIPSPLSFGRATTPTSHTPRSSPPTSPARATLMMHANERASWGKPAAEST